MSEKRPRPETPVPSIGWSDFARDRYPRGGGRTYFDGDPAELLDLIRDRWDLRTPGSGRDGLDEVVIVPLPPERFVCGTIRVGPETALHAEFHRRQPHEDGYVRITAEGPREPARHAGVVLYSAETLLENGGERSGDCDWEIVCLLASPDPDEPMDPLTMARNMLAKPGGTPCEYTARQFAEAVWYWSSRADAQEPRSR